MRLKRTMNTTLKGTLGIGLTTALAVALAILGWVPRATAVISAPTDTYLQIHFDAEKYRPGDVAAVTVMAHGYPAGLASVTAELHYDTSVFGAPTAGADFLTGGLMEGATSLEPIHAPGTVAINMSRSTGTTADTGTGAKVFTLHFPVLTTAPDVMSALVRFLPVTGRASGGVLLLDATDNVIPASGVDGSAEVGLLGGSITGQVSLQNHVTGNFSGISVSVKGHELSTVTDASGNFTIADLEEGVYSLHISKPGYLVTDVFAVSVVLGHTTDLNALLEEPLSLIPGNIANAYGLPEDTIFLEDLAALARATGSTAADTGPTAFGTTWNAAADLDGNGSVGASDLALLAQNWGLSGAHGTLTPAPGTLIHLGTPVQAAPR